MVPDPEELVQIRIDLIQNASRWLNRGLDAFETGEDETGLTLTVLYCAISFELLAKALVFHHRWDLIFEDSTKADLAELKRGEAKTIGLNEAERRLKELNIRCKKEFRAFKVVSVHRNKIVHFFHPDLPSETHRLHVASEVAMGWAASLRLLRHPEFSGIVDFRSPGFTGLEGRLLSLTRYLEAQENLIRRTHGSPEELFECDFCHRETYAFDHCLLCGSFEETHGDIMDGADYIAPAECPECGENVARLVDGGARCSNPECGKHFAVFGVCEWCHSSYVLEEEEAEDVPPEDQTSTHLTGCGNCGGYVGYLSSKDD